MYDLFDKLTAPDRAIWLEAVKHAETGQAHFRCRLKNPKLKQFFDYWLGLYLRHRAAKAAFDPMDIPRLLGHIQIFELSPDGRLRMRLSGTHANSIVGRDLTGKYLEDFIDADHLQLRYFILTQTLIRGLPVCYTDSVRVDNRDFFWTQRLLLPMRDNEGDYRYLYSMVLPHSQPGAESDHDLATAASGSDGASGQGSHGADWGDGASHIPPISVIVAGEADL